MNNLGFQINKLVATGNDVMQASLDFVEGLNVITGASNTGKTYVFQAIDFLLGGKRAPKTTPESQLYETLFLEIKASSFGTILIKRDISNGKPKVYECSYAQHVTKNIQTKEFTPKDSSGKNLGLAEFVLSLCGAERVRAKANKANKTVSVSFRTLRHFFIVGETEILEETSPAWLKGMTQRTLSASLLKFLLTGKDDSDLEKPIDDKILVGNSAKYQVLTDLVNDLSEELKGMPLSLGFNIEDSIISTSSELQETANRIAELEIERQTLIASQAKLESEVLFNTELLSRFDILKEHYASDLNRLDFIAEGSFLIEQLEFVNCPFCFSPLDIHARHEACKSGAITPEQLENSCKKEQDKVRLQLIDLEGTIKQVKNNNEELNNQITVLNRKHILSGMDISFRLVPKLEELKNDLQSMRFQYADNTLRRLTEKRLNDLVEMREQWSPQTKEKSIAPENAYNLPDEEIQQFCSQVELLLTSWGVSDGQVNFNFEDMDLVIAGKNRAADGKGLRAITHSAYIIGLMKYCQTKNLPHTNMLILDSPITNYKQNAKKNELVDTIQDSFFQNLSEGINEQIIIFENKEPVTTASGKINIIHFSGEPEIGRQGFFPKM